MQLNKNKINIRRYKLYGRKKIYLLKLQYIRMGSVQLNLF